MTPPRDAPASRFRSQATLVYGAGAATGLQIGLMQCFVARSWRPLLSVVPASLVFSTGTLALWQLVFPKLPARPRSRRLFLQGAIALLVSAFTSFLVINVPLFLSEGKWMLTPYTGGDLTVVFPARLLALAPLIYFVLPIVPVAFMAVVGFNQSWWQIFLLETRAHQASELAASAQLDALRAQINPHFLFNSLNSIAQLISVDPERAESCVERLAEIFRYLLRSENRAFVTLADELEIVDAYLDIERARFGDRLRVAYEVDDAARTRIVPTLILQPLIENAVRHGVSQKIEGGRVTIQARLDAGDLRVVIRDTGVGIAGGAEAALNGGIGLRNVRDRLVHLFGEKYAPEIRTREGEGTTVTVRVPRVAHGPANAEGKTVH
ncbi:MAG TPA: histidine kinase [Candidatus Binatia bacterium]|nr:histidine kinase [Candidatus Binatia bacterium]